MKTISIFIFLFSLHCCKSHQKEKVDFRPFVCFDSLVLEEGVIIKALIDTSNKSKYVLVAETNQMSDTLNVSPVMSFGTFPSVIYHSGGWSNQYKSINKKQSYFSCQLFQEVGLFGVQIVNGQPFFLIPNEPCVSNSAFIVEDMGFEVPLIRGDNNGKSIHFNFDLNPKDKMTTTPARILNLLDGMPFDE